MHELHNLGADGIALEHVEIVQHNSENSNDTGGSEGGEAKEKPGKEYSADIKLAFDRLIVDPIADPNAIGKVYLSFVYFKFKW